MDKIRYCSKLDLNTYMCCIGKSCFDMHDYECPENYKYIYKNYLNINFTELH